MDTFSCIAVDMGAASIRTITGTISDNRLLIKEVSRFRNEIKVIKDHERWDIENILNEINKSFSSVFTDDKLQIESIGVDSWGVDFVLLDNNHDLLDIPVSYRDARTKNMQNKWLSIMSREETFRKTGINFYEFNTLFQLLSIKDEEIIRKTSLILFLPCYVSYRLSGKLFNELTIASTSQLLNVDNNEMNEEILSHLNLSPGHFGKIIEPGTIIGNVNEGFILPPDVKMTAVCGHDTAGAIMAVPSEKRNYAFISTGTWCIAGMVSDAPVLDSFALNNGFTNERGFNNTYRILKNIIGLWLIQGLQISFRHKYNFEKIVEVLQTTKSKSIILPDDALFFNPTDMKEAFDLFLRRTRQKLPDSPGEYFKIAYDSLCCSFKDNMDKLEKMLNTKIDTIHLIGGGSRSEYLCRQAANITQRKIVAGPVECSAIGNIIVQGIASGKVKNEEEGRIMVKNSFDITEYIPDTSNKHVKMYERYKNLTGK